MADTFQTRTLSNYLASLPASPSPDVSLVTQDLKVVSGELYLTSADVAVVAISGEYSDILNPPELGALAGKEQIAVPDDVAATGTPSNSTFLRGDGAWAPVSDIGGGQVNAIVEGSGIDVDATDPANPIVAIQIGYLATVATTGAYGDLTGSPTLGTAAAANTGDFAPASHVGAGGVAHANAVAGGDAGFMTGADKAKLDGLNKADVGLGNVDNTSDADKPMSDEQANFAYFLAMTS